MRQVVYTGLPDLLPGDLVEIKYKVWRGSSDGADLAERWLRAEIIVATPGSHPLARLIDGQITELRPYMPCRIVSLARRATLRAA